ncbi:MAG: hypothetical protein QXF07_02475 [Candidatus Micrarchaeia archaeon]
MIREHQIDYFEFKQEKEKLEEGGNITIKLNSVKAKKEMLEIKYTFLIEYKQKSGSMTIKGTILAETSDAKKGQQLWQKEKKLPEDIEADVLNEIANFNRIRAAGVLRALRSKIEVVKEEKPKEPAA